MCIEHSLNGGRRGEWQASLAMGRSFEVRAKLQAKSRSSRAATVGLASKGPAWTLSHHAVDRRR